MIASLLAHVAVGVSCALTGVGSGSGPADVQVDTLPPLERGYEILASEEPGRAREPLLEAAADLPAERATTVLRIVSILDRVEEPASWVAARAFLAGERGAAEEAVAIVVECLDRARREDRAALLALAADYADRFDFERAAVLRNRIVEEHARSLEGPEAAWLLARHRARSRDGVAEAVRILEDLIVANPNHPLAPEARREMERLRGHLPGGTMEYP